MFVAIEAAMDRGVDVTVLVPNKSESSDRQRGFFPLS
ncbi:hypothetical protein ACI2OX_20350 [Bacillus sp. N9]